MWNKAKTFMAHKLLNFLFRNIDYILEHSQKLKKLIQFQILVSEDLNQDRQRQRQLYIDLAFSFLKHGDRDHAYEILKMLKINYPEDAQLKAITPENMLQFLRINASDAILSS